jgi:hypothetical protein
MALLDKMKFQKQNHEHATTNCSKAKSIECFQLMVSFLLGAFLIENIANKNKTTKEVISCRVM